MRLTCRNCADLPQRSYEYSTYKSLVRSLRLMVPKQFKNFLNRLAVIWCWLIWGNLLPGADMISDFWKCSSFVILSEMWIAQDEIRSIQRITVFVDPSRIFKCPQSRTSTSLVSWRTLNLTTRWSYGLQI
jgi:hypothetical protein